MVEAWLASLCHQDDEQPDATLDPFFHLGRDIDSPVTSGRGDADLLRRLRVLWYVAPQQADTAKVVNAWFRDHAVS